MAIFVHEDDDHSVVRNVLGDEGMESFAQAISKLMLRCCERGEVVRYD